MNDEHDGRDYSSDRAPEPRHDEERELRKRALQQQHAREHERERAERERSDRERESNKKRAGHRSCNDKSFTWPRHDDDGDDYVGDYDHPGHRRHLLQN
jgi:hypothetical protein